MGAQSQLLSPRTSLRYAGGNWILEADSRLRGRMLSKLSALKNRKWVQVALLTLAGTFAFVLISLGLQFPIFEQVDAGMFWREAFGTLVVSIIFVAPLLVLLGSKLTENASLKQKYAQELAHDSLTSCLTGPLFTAAIDVIATSSATGRRPGALLVIDMDHLRRLNEQIGYAAGNQALSAIAAIIRASVRSGDLVGRIGGDEFAVYLPGATKANAEKVAERIRNAVAEASFEPVAGGLTWPLTVSVGAVLFETDATADELLLTADRQMQAAKEKGRNRVEYAHLRQGSSPSRPSLH
ncbi:GGDEF domain-containing protein [Aminobacter sp. NyZ550]|uniref:GGDEF domain-containing protein n=1 Tax=Aminobacter sp. NyZ550 TaxID=2979870 RepID=UPI0021D56E00|nr:GGDEF domain-containing protein [Aminobacter sp. NyZ550]WAX93473.1 GGDEF domain-containing protein [Aminobacter sp. NyZ550]